MSTKKGKKTLEAFVATIHLSVEFGSPVARQNFSLLATAHDCEIALIIVIIVMVIIKRRYIF